MGCGCGGRNSQRNVNSGAYGSRSGFKNAEKELPTPVLRQMALRKQINETARKQKQQQLKTIKQRIINDKRQG